MLLIGVQKLLMGGFDEQYVVDINEGDAGIGEAGQGDINEGLAGEEAKQGDNDSNVIDEDEAVDANESDSKDDPMWEGHAVTPRKFM